MLKFSTITKILLIFVSVFFILDIQRLVSRLKKIDLIYFFFLFLLSFSIFYFQNNQGQGWLVMLSHQSPDGKVTRQIMRLGRIQQKIREQMMSYNMDTICWPHGLHMVVQGRVHSTQHGPFVGLYKIDQFVEEFFIKFSCIT